ncbi:hypothetical protein U879_05720 [Defluviimonas sp. 20V17]|uniref:Uncharacterized protein n=1 Tax=Allgaiera indica TaxID=765699 RepID=A0AAN4USW0_9RHOB|nr:hypothetical protein [Allgaiera indica]KDB04637.1 hypothetical protein U879_05720 [Defluviimonas sp. 20V17]GHE03738.1 hypothetical protein GCM10008024_28290 [Allgaiera indica]SDX73652.1 hypothetical protein SAMN05444006_1278 [Allgaiera indica]
MAAGDPLARCMVCGAPHAAFGLRWPGLPSSMPVKVRTVGRFRHCGAPDCLAQAIARIATFACQPFPWSATCYPPEVRDRVAEIIGEPPAPSPPPHTTPTPAQGTLI